MSFNPIEAKRSQKYTRQELDNFFKGPGRVVQEVKEKNPALYKEYRDAYEALGGIGKSLQPNPAPNVPYRPPVRQYEERELALRGQYPEQFIRDFFSNATAANALYTSDRNEYEARREAGVSYGLVKARPTPYVPVAKVVELPDLYRISPELAEESGLPRDVELPWSQYEQLIRQKVARARQAQADADAKIEADRLTELEKLNAKQRADQAVIDQKQKDAERRLELLVPRQNEVPDPAIALGRAMAQERERVKAVETPAV